MGTRLYPQTQDTDILEKLAGVPTGTAQALELFSEAVKDLTEHQLMMLTGADGRAEAIFKLRKQRPELEDYDNFLTFGWGRLQGGNLLTSENRACGGTKDLALTKRLLQAQEVILPQGVTTANLGGLCWL